MLLDGGAWSGDAGRRVDAVAALPGRGGASPVDSRAGDVIQFERRGFYRVDVAFRPPVCNNGKTTYPRLVYVPDGKPQHKVPFSRLPSAAKK